MQKNSHKSWEKTKNVWILQATKWWSVTRENQDNSKGRETSSETPNLLIAAQINTISEIDDTQKK